MRFLYIPFLREPPVDSCDADSCGLNSCELKIGGWVGVGVGLALDSISVATSVSKLTDGTSVSVIVVFSPSTNSGVSLVSEDSSTSIGALISAVASTTFSSDD